MKVTSRFVISSLLTATALFVLLGCKHPLEIIGQGDIVSLAGDRDCAWRDQPCMIVFEDAYVERYSATADEGWEFVSWTGCNNQVLDNCVFDISAELVQLATRGTMSPLIAKFERKSAPVPQFVSQTLSGVGEVRGILKVRKKVYVAAGSSGMYIYKIRNNGDMAFRARYEFSAGLSGHSVRSLVMIDDYLYMASRSEGLIVMDVSKVTDIREVFRYASSPHKITFLELSGSTLYVSNRTHLHTFDVSDPSQPIHLGDHRARTEYERVLVDGDLIYAAGFYDGLVVIDNSDPANLEILTTVNIDRFAIWAVEKYGDYLFVAGEGSGIYTLDISDPINPTIINRLELPSEADPKPKDQPPFELKVHGGFLYVADGYSGLQIVDISDPANPFLAVTYDTPGYAWDISFDELSILLGDYQHGFQLLDIGSSLDVDNDGVPNYVDDDPYVARP